MRVFIGITLAALLLVLGIFALEDPSIHRGHDEQHHQPKSRTMSDWNPATVRKIPLSPWQLVTMSDIMIEIAFKRCSLNPPIDRSLKNYIRRRVAKAPQQTRTSSIFFQEYSDLVSCLRDIPDPVRITPETSTGNDEAKLSLTKDFTALTEFLRRKGQGRNASELLLPTPPAENNKTNINAQSTSSISNFAKSTWTLVGNVVETTLHLVKNLINRLKWGGTGNTSSELNNGNGNPGMGPKIVALAEFSDLISNIVKLVQHACPFKAPMIGQEVLLAHQVGNEIFEWISKDDTEIVRAGEYFFKNANILEKIKDCHQNAMAWDELFI